MKNLRRCTIVNRCLAGVPLLAAALIPLASAAEQGLVPRAGDWLWPQLQARITVQTAALAPLALGNVNDTVAVGARGVQGGGIFGDYVIATPRFGNFRATSGMMLGAQGGAPVLSAAPGVGLGVTILDAGYGASAGANDGIAALPYLGLGYSSASLWRSFSLNADVGIVAGRAAGLGRAVLGNQARDVATRDLRLAPVLQLGVQYSF